MDSGLPKINKVLVLLATFNGSKFIEKQLETILNQSDVDVEILISYKLICLDCNIFIL